MQLIADLHIHSKYSRAVSPQMVIPEIAKWARLKGIDLVGTADFTHPLWRRELAASLKEAGEGLYKEKSENSPYFIISGEISSIYTQGGKLRRIHTLVLVPSLKQAEKIGQELAKRGNVMSDGRPIFGLSARDIADLVLNVSPESLIIPAHIWTPHFSLYGSQSGFDSLEECFGNLGKYIYAVETGLSSDPAMNWRIDELKDKSIISCSDAHSGAKLGREATVFEVEDIKKLRYQDIRNAIVGYHENEKYHEYHGNKNFEARGTRDTSSSRGTSRIAYTLEFYPEEGKYHYTGHRNCNIKQSPEETIRLGQTCPVCGRRLTIGVMHRVEQLGRTTDNIQHRIDERGVRWMEHPQKNRPPYAMLVPLLEILVESLKVSIANQKLLNEYKNLIGNFGGEFNVLLEAKTDEIEKISGKRVAEGIKKVRGGDIIVEPGYDGVFGTVKIWPFAPQSGAQAFGSEAQARRGKPSVVPDDKEQMALF